MPSLKLPTFPQKPAVSKARVFYAQPSGVKPSLLDLYQATAKELDISPAQVRAFAIVESDEKPFSPNGNPVIRFEVSRWKRYRVADKAAMAFDKAKNPADLDARWEMFRKMCAVNETAAIMSHSFGLFQILGANYKLCLCADPVSFLKENMTVEGQFKMFRRFVKMSPALLSAIRLNRAEGVGHHYNGPQYKKFKYDTKWAAASKAGGAGVWA